MRLLTLTINTEYSTDVTTRKPSHLEKDSWVHGLISYLFVGGEIETLSSI